MLLQEFVFKLKLWSFLVIIFFTASLIHCFFVSRNSSDFLDFFSHGLPIEAGAAPRLLDKLIHIQVILIFVYHYILQVKVSGYAASGGGRGIDRVDVSVDGGKTWVEASRYQKPGVQYISDDMNSDKWAWVLFDVTVDAPQSTEIVVKAVCFPLL